MAVYDAGGVYVYGWLAKVNSPWLRLVLVLGDSFEYSRFCGFVVGVLALLPVYYNIVCHEELLLVVIVCGLFVWRLFSGV